MHHALTPARHNNREPNPQEFESLERHRSARNQLAFVASFAKLKKYVLHAK